MTSAAQPPTPPSSGHVLQNAGSRGDLWVKMFARTDVGQIREHNEDNFLVADLSRRSRGLIDAKGPIQVGAQGSIFAVCDGMGGAAAGEIASQFAVDILFEQMLEGLDPNTRIERDELARKLVHAVELAGQRIFNEAKNDRTRRGMGTTVTAAALVDSHLFLAQVGDSRAYILRNGVLVQVTRDQSLVNQLIEAGQLTEEEAETFEHNNIILQALGTADSVQVDLTYVELRKGDTLLLCSDGLSGMVRFDEIRRILTSVPEPIEACRALTDQANHAGGHDNITVIVATFDGEALSPPRSDEPSLRYRKYPLSGGPSPDSSSTHATAGAESYNAQAFELVQRRASGSSAPQGLSGTIAFMNGGFSPVADLPPIPRSPSYSDERIEIPGTHVPGWAVAALVVGVILILLATVFLVMGP